MPHFRKTLLWTVLLSVVVGAGIVWSQDSQDDLPPQVIGVQPYPGEEMRLDQPLTIIFNQAMETGATESAITLTPSIEGAFAWSDGDKTLTFTPADGWTRGQAYTVTVGEGTTAANGLTIADPYEFTAQIAGYLFVSSTIPADGVEGVAADATITIAFNRPVVPLGATADMDALPSPLSISPAIEGQGEWLNTSIYTFKPNQPLQGGTTYTVTVAAGLQDLTGAVLENDSIFSFQTLVPEILSTNPQNTFVNIWLESPVTVNFSQPMDKASVEASFKLISPDAGAVAGQFAWSEDATTLTFTPAENLKIASTYRVVIDAALAKGLGGASIREGRDFTFSTLPLPYIADTSPRDGETGILPVNGRTHIYFGSIMNTATFEGRVKVEPEGTAWTAYVHDEQSNVLSLEFPFMPQTKFTITLLAGSEDIYGNQIENDYTYSFTTGEIPPSASLMDSGQTIVTGAYRETTSLPMGVSGDPQVQFELYRVPPEQYEAVIWRNYQEDSWNAVRNQSEQVRVWTEQVDLNGAAGIWEVKLAEDGGALPAGVYFVIGSWTPPQNRDPLRWPVTVIVADANVTYKRTVNDVMVWVTDMQTAAPLPNQEVTIMNNGAAIGQGTTDAEGLLRLPLELGSDWRFISIEAKSSERYGLWYTEYASAPPTQSVYFYTDRPIYRPGETIYYKGVYRVQDDVNFSVPSSPPSLRLQADVNYGQMALLEEAITLNEFGTFSGEIVLPEDAPIGIVSFTVKTPNEDWLGSGSAQVAEFRVPEFSVTLTPEQDEITAGDPLRAVVNSVYFSGGTVSNATVNWYATSSPSYFNYRGEGRYNFTDAKANRGYFDYYYGYGGPTSRQLGSGTGTTDANGNLMIELDGSLTAQESPATETIMIEANQSDESGQYISGRANVTLHPADVYVGLQTSVYFAKENEPFNANVITVTPQSDTVAEQAVTLTLFEYRWERTPIEGQFGQYTWEEKEIEVERVSITTDAQGKASHEFTPPNAGTFYVVAETRDARERLHRSSVRLWVTGQTRVYWGRPSTQLELVADKESYAIGDTAEILVPVSQTGISWLLITTERAGVMQTEVKQVEGTTYVHQLPITEDFAPVIYFSVAVVHGIDEDSTVPVYASGNLALPVDPSNKRLTLTVTPSVENAQPGDTVTLDIETRDASGAPIQAEVSLAMVDAAILTLSAPNSVDPETHFYSSASLYVNTASMLTALIDARNDNLQEEIEKALEQTAMARQEGEFAADGMVGEIAMSAAPTMDALPMAGGGGGGGGGFEQVEVRTDFQQTPLWEAHIVTDSDGRAQVSVTLPDNLTIWDISARALTADTRVAHQDLDVASTLPLLVRPATPRFFVVGDEVTLAMVVNNNSGDAQTVRTTLQGTGFELVDGETLEKSVDIEKDGRARVEWRVTILDVTGVDLTFIALGADGYQDASKPPLATGPDDTIPVYRYTAPDTTGTGGVLRDAGSRTEGISIPPIADVDQGELTIRVDPSLAATTVDALDYLENFPHQCIEQTISRFLPNVITFRALQTLGVQDNDLEADLRVVVDQALSKLAADQNPDGGWGWFRHMESNPLVTAYALLGLSEARAAGFDFNVEMLNRAATFIRSDLVQPTENTEPWRLNRQAFYFYVLSRYGDDNYKPTLNDLDRLFAVRLEMSLYAKAYLLQAYTRLYNEASDQANALASDLISGAKLSATGAHWEEDYTDWWNWNTDIRSTAIVLSALISVDPTNELLPNAVRWLMVARQGDAWETTQETAWSVMALTDWMASTGELRGDYSFAVALNGAEQATGQVTPETVREGQKLVIEVGDLLLDEINRVTFTRGEGEGALYYTAHLRLRLDASEAKATDRGVGIVREYFIIGEDGQEQAVTEATAGDVVHVRLTVTVDETLYYFVLEDALPAGLEALDTSLLTTTRAVDGPQLTTPQYNPWYWWYWWVWDHTEIRDESVNLYADTLPPGTYVYTYQTQAITPGKFQTMPSHGYAFYFPEVFGRSDGLLFTVHPQAEATSEE